jgi:tRNA(Arg) A34 adenosine deaminase TadA
MCLAFACLARVGKIVYYAEDKKFGGVSRIFALNSAFAKPEIVFMEREEAIVALRNFFKNKR